MLCLCSNIVLCMCLGQVPRLIDGVLPEVSNGPNIGLRVISLINQVSLDTVFYFNVCIVSIKCVYYLNNVNNL